MQDIMRYTLAEMIEEHLSKLAEEKEAFMDGCSVELEADGWVSITKSNGDTYNIKVTRAKSQ